MKSSGKALRERFSQDNSTFPALTKPRNSRTCENQQTLKVKNNLNKLLALFFLPSRYFGQRLWLAVGWFKVPSAWQTVMGCDGSADTTRPRRLCLTPTIVSEPLGALPASGRKVDQLGVANQAAAISGPFFPRFLRSKFKSQNYYSPNA